MINLTAVLNFNSIGFKYDWSVQLSKLLLYWHGIVRKVVGPESRARDECDYPGWIFLPKSLILNIWLLKSQEKTGLFPNFCPC